MSRQVSELMRPATEIVASSTITVRTAAELFIVRGLPLLILVNDEQQFEGIVAESAVVRRLMATSDTATCISEIVHRHVETAHATTQLATVMPLFRSSCHATIPVLDDQRHVVGVLNRNDIVQHLLDSESAEEMRQGPHFGQKGRSERSSHVQRKSSEESGEDKSAQ